YENLFWAFIYNIIGIPLAAGVWIPITGWTLSPMFGAAAMSLSSFCVVTNALRLNLINPHKPKRKSRKQPLNIDIDEFVITEKEQDTMTKTVKIDGMMCPHCEAAVKKALEAFPQVDSADVSHEQGTAVLTLNADLSNDEIKRAVEEKEYTFISAE
ncbi:MAG: cation transporter, partial [Eubacterium sp.]|nr:cation transporter [Eubacterium sp.]